MILNKLYSEIRKDVIFDNLKLETKIRIMRKKAMKQPKTNRFLHFLKIVKYQKQVLRNKELYRNLLIQELRIEFNQIKIKGSE